MSGGRRTSLPTVRELRVDQVGRGTLLAGRYRVLEPEPSTVPVLQTWAAVDEILDRPVRAQVLAPEVSAAALDAARRAALVTDPRLLRVLDVGSHDGLGYVVTEQVSGPSLAQLVMREPLTADQARAVVGEAAAALEVARRRGVHHQALRPSAICVADDGRVLVSGLALDAALLGRVESDARNSSRSDAVDLVRLLYTALTGRWPGPAAAADGVPTAPVVDGAPVPPGDLVTAVPPDLDTLCAVTLGPYDDGPHSPAEVVRELEPWGEIRITRPGGRAAAAAGTTAGVLGAASADAAAADAATVAATPPRVTRQSVRTAFTQGTPGTNRPGTPPPAAPGRTSAFPAVPAPPAFAAAPPFPAPPAFPEPSAFPEPAAPVAPPAAATPGGPVGGPPVFPPTSAGPRPAPPAPVPDDVGTAPQSPVRAAVPRRSTSALPPTAAAPAAAAPASAAAARAATPVFPGPAVPPAPAPAAPPATRPPAIPPTGVLPDPPVTPAASWQPSSSDRRPSDEDPFEFGRVDEEPSGGRRFDPTIVVLGVVVLIVIIGVALAAKALLGGSPARLTGGTTSGSHSASASAGQSASGSPSASASPLPSGGAPVIASAAVVDPGAPTGDHPETVAKAIDGDPSTFWVSYTYKQANFGGLKPGLGYVITLKQPTTVSTVTLHVNGTGGNVEIHAADASNPSGGAVLASGPLSGDAVLTLAPATSTSSISLWFTQLPTTADGSFRIELTEVQLG